MYVIYACYVLMNILCSIHEIVFRPDGEVLFAAAGSKVHVSEPCHI